jgi:hypothetical protein
MPPRRQLVRRPYLPAAAEDAAADGTGEKVE